MRRSALVALVAALALLVACGSEDSPAEESTSEQGSHDVGAVVANIEGLLDEMVAAYADGDAEAAGEFAADAYLENYEEIEHSVEEADEELNEEIETLLGTQMRASISEGVDVTELEDMVAEAKALLQEAVAALGDGE